MQVNEELTFDYQFQTFGKKRHKCYCGSEKCRGYLGSSSGSGTSGSGGNPTLDYIWEEDSSEDETSSSEEEEDDNEDEDAKSEKSDSKLEVESNNKRHKDNKDFDVKNLVIYYYSMLNLINILMGLRSIAKSKESTL